MGVGPPVPAGHRLQAAGEEAGPQEEAVDRPGPAAGVGRRGAADRPAGVALPP